MISLKFKDTFRERLPEWIVSMALVLWGIIVMNEPSSLWDQAYFHVLANLAPQNIWGVMAITVGVFRVIALGINGAWRPTGHMRAFGALISALLWAAIIISYLGLDWNPPAIASKSALLAIDISALWFAAGDAKLADIKANGGLKKLEPEAKSVIIPVEGS